jgi:hypothetical protein
MPYLDQAEESVPVTTAIALKDITIYPVVEQQGPRTEAAKIGVENSFKSFHLAFGFAVMLLEGRPKVFRVRSFGHLWKRRENFLLREIDVFKSVVKEIIKSSWVL